MAWSSERLRQPGEVLYDVGANIGVYTLLAAVAVPGARVVAFEPGAPRTSPPSARTWT